MKDIVDNNGFNNIKIYKKCESKEKSLLFMDKFLES